jgi:hypothetical protein
MTLALSVDREDFDPDLANSCEYCNVRSAGQANTSAACFIAVLNITSTIPSMRQVKARLSNLEWLKKHIQ